MKYHILQVVAVVDTPQGEDCLVKETGYLLETVSAAPSDVREAIQEMLNEHKGPLCLHEWFDADNIHAVGWWQIEVDFSDNRWLASDKGTLFKLTPCKE